MSVNWNNDKSIVLSQICTAVFALILLFIDVSAYWLVSSYTRLKELVGAQGMILTTVYLCSVPAWILLWKLWSLLGNIKRGEIFTAENVSALRTVSWCCAAAAIVCLVSALYFLPFFIVAVAAAFMCLIVRIVKNTFQQALLMKDELDLTV